MKRTISYRNKYVNGRWTYREYEIDDDMYRRRGDETDAGCSPSEIEVRKQIVKAQYKFRMRLSLVAKKLGILVRKAQDRHDIIKEMTEHKKRYFEPRGRIHTRRGLVGDDFDEY